MAVTETLDGGLGVRTRDWKYITQSWRDPAAGESLFDLRDDPGEQTNRAREREDVVRPGLLFAATEETVYVSWDDGANWQSLGQNLPNVQVSDLVVKENFKMLIY